MRDFLNMLRAVVTRPMIAAGAAISVALTAAGCASATPVASPAQATPSSTAALAGAGTGQPLSCIALVSRHATSVGIQVRTVLHARIKVVAHYATTSYAKEAWADANGRHTFAYDISATTPAYTVKVDVGVATDHRKGSCSASFTSGTRIAATSSPSPSYAPAPAPSPSAPAPAPGPTTAAWCTATASVYNAEYDWNNVYVNSNQPYQDATASADGDSFGYETNGSGYAEIYLNGPPPGAEITVTVGGATCTTSD
jgi:hypothetical protein